MLNFYTLLGAGAKGDTGQLENNLTDFGTQIKSLLDTLWPWLLGVGVALIAFWGLYIGIRIVKAKAAEEKQQAKALVKQLIVGILVIFIIATGLPLVITGIAQWAGVSFTPLA